MSVVFRGSGKICKHPYCRTFMSFKWGKNNERCANETCGKPFKPLFFEMFGEDAEMPPELKKICDLRKREAS